MKRIQTFESFLNEDKDYDELKTYLTKKYPGFKLYPAETGEINVGFLKKDNDYTWDNVMTYYWNTNYEIEECSVNKVKI
jgi:hypothetical protein